MSTAYEPLPDPEHYEMAPISPEESIVKSEVPTSPTIPPTESQKRAVDSVLGTYELPDVSSTGLTLEQLNGLDVRGHLREPGA